MALWDSIKEIRLKARLTQLQFADILGCTPMHISAIERPYSETRRTASEELLKIIAEKFSTSEKEKHTLEIKLLTERNSIPSKRRMYFEPKEHMEKISLTPAAFMPARFLEQLKKDIKNKGYLLSKPHMDLIDRVLKGEYILPKKSVIEIALKLRQPIEDYLMLADYIPDDIINIVHHNGISKLFRTMSKLDTEELDEVISIVNNELRKYMKKRGGI